MINLKILEEGIRWRKEKKLDWSKDFASSFYDELYGKRPNHLNEEWWRSQVDRLWEWKAIRSNKPPNTKEEIFSRGKERLVALDEHYQTIKIKAGNAEPSLENVQWADIASLFELMGQIKGSNTPVFASKLGHFIFSKAFIVVDTEMTGLFPYELLWCGFQAIWQNFKDKEKAKKCWPQKFKNKHPFVQTFPLKRGSRSCV